ncbi:hypothetical protein H9P43_000463 [Blastocladiella emersonii ATCC 22665]|nr:hypothetical protein H9P43_000463 [Blastocladiella emersonii ATCC 22665]
MSRRQDTSSPTRQPLGPAATTATAPPTMASSAAASPRLRDMRPRSNSNASSDSSLSFEVPPYGFEQTHADRVSKAEGWHSTDVEVVDNRFGREHYQRILTRAEHLPFKRLATFMPTFASLFLAALIGIISASIYYALHHFTAVFQAFRFKLLADTMGSFPSLWGILFGISVLVSAVGVGLSLWEPTASGSGMPEVIAYLNGVERPRFVSWRTLLAKIVGMWCATNSGLYTGYDGPLIHACTITAIVIIRNVKKVPFFARWLFGETEWDEKTLPVIRGMRSAEIRLFATMGAAAGVASAFQAPLAGVCFAIEEAMSFYDPSLIIRSLFACAMSLVTISIYSHGTKRNGNDYSIYAANAHCNVSLTALDYLSYLILGILGGVLGHSYNVLVAKVRIARAKAFQRTVISKAIEVLVLVLITSLATSLFFYGPNFNTISSAQPLCTEFDRSVEHIAKINTPPASCVKSCAGWLKVADDEYAGKCISELQDKICADDEVFNALSAFAAKKQDIVTATCRFLANRTAGGNSLGKRAAAASAATEADDDADEGGANVLRLTILPNRTEIASLFLLAGGSVKTRLPDFLYTDSTLVTKSASSSSSAAHLQAAPMSAAYLQSAQPVPAAAVPHHLQSEIVLAQMASAAVDEETKLQATCYYQLPSLVLNQPEQVIVNLFQRGYYYLFEANVLFYFGALYVVLSLATHNITMPTDLVTPTLVIGATFGRLYGLGFNQLQRTLLTNAALMDPGAAALLGMAAFWAGTSRMMITIVVVAVQSTGDMTYINGTILVVLIAAFIGNHLGPSQFHLEIEALKLPYLPHHPPLNFHAMTIRELLNKLPDAAHRELHTILLNDTFTVEAAERLLTFSRYAGPDVDAFVYNGFPVVDHKGHLLGLILRSQLERIVAKVAPNAQIAPTGHTGAVFTERPEALSSLDEKIRRSQFSHLGREFKGTDPEAVLKRSLAAEVAEHMNRSPHSVHSETIASKAYGMFRLLGLRHLVVTDTSNKAFAILTRRDLFEVIEALHHEAHHGHGHGHGDAHHSDGGHAAPHAAPGGDIELGATGCSAHGGGAAPSHLARYASAAQASFATASSSSYYEVRSICINNVARPSRRPTCRVFSVPEGVPAPMRSTDRMPAYAPAAVVSPHQQQQQHYGMPAPAAVHFSPDGGLAHRMPHAHGGSMGSTADLGSDSAASSSRDLMPKPR